MTDPTQSKLFENQTPKATTGQQNVWSDTRPVQNVAPQPEAPMQQNALPQDFVYETEHPEMPVPFKMLIAGHKLEGIGLSVTAAFVAINGPFDDSWVGRKEVVQMVFQFKGFAITLSPEMVVVGSRGTNEMTLQFIDPLGDHLPQLRYILNSFIAGDFVTMNGMLGFSGPVKPKNSGGNNAGEPKRRIRSIALALLSSLLILMAANILISRATKEYESRPVFITRSGTQMTATAPGQVSYINPEAKKDEVVFSINTNSGDVLSFKMPCDCEVTVYDGIIVGATVLPIDIILSLFESNATLRVETQMSVEGLSKVLNGNKVFLEMTDGRVIPTEVTVTPSTNTAALRGDPFVPVILVPKDGMLSTVDIGKSARLRLSKTLFGFAIPSILDIL